VSPFSRRSDGALDLRRHEVVALKGKAHGAMARRSASPHGATTAHGAAERSRVRVGPHSRGRRAFDILPSRGRGRAGHLQRAGKAIGALHASILCPLVAPLGGAVLRPSLASTPCNSRATRRAGRATYEPTRDRPAPCLAAGRVCGRFGPTIPEIELYNGPQG
jgi:hypothetical protein